MASLIKEYIYLEASKRNTPRQPRPRTALRSPWTTFRKWRYDRPIAISDICNELLIDFRVKTAIRLTHISISAVDTDA